MMLQLEQIGLLDSDTVSNLWGRADSEMIGKEMRDFAKRKAHAAIVKERQDEQLQQVKEQKMQQLQLEMKKEKDVRKKWKVRLTVGVDRLGNLKRLEKQDVPDEDIEKVCTALENAITASAPFKNVPGFKGPELQFVVKLSGAKVRVEKPSL